MERSPPSPTPPALRAPHSHLRCFNSCRSGSRSPPLRGEGSHGDIRWKAASGGGADAGFPKDQEESARENPFLTGSPPGSPRAVDRGWISALGVGLTGRGLAPSPVSASCLQRPDSTPTDCRTPVTPLSAGGYPCIPLQSPCSRRGAVRGDTEMQTPESVKKDRYSPPLRVPVIEIRCTSVEMASGNPDLAPLSTKTNGIPSTG